jgi:hypothetical protein
MGREVTALRKGDAVRHKRTKEAGRVVSTAAEEMPELWRKQLLSPVLVSWNKLGESLWTSREFLVFVGRER